MTNDLLLRASDTVLALFFAWLLVISLMAGRLCGRRGFQWNRRERPGFYAFGIAFLALMVLHFGGLAWVGQLRG